MSTPQAVILVYSTSHAIRLEGLLNAKGIACRLTPVPRQLGSDCGVCVQIQRADLEQARQVIQAARLETAGIHEI